MNSVKKCTLIFKKDPREEEDPNRWFYDLNINNINTVLGECMCCTQDTGTVVFGDRREDCNGRRRSWFPDISESSSICGLFSVKGANNFFMYF